MNYETRKDGTTMPSFNKCMMIGNLTRDPQLKYLPSQTPVVDFGLACNRKFKTAAGEDKEEVCFVDCQIFGKSAETLNQYCRKGKPLFVEGRLTYQSWEDKQGGGKRSKLFITVERFQFLGSRDDGGGPHPDRQAAQDRDGSPFADAPGEITDADCPF
jgi:single-strand DNA-binding protein